MQSLAGKVPDRLLHHIRHSFQGFPGFAIDRVAYQRVGNVLHVNSYLVGAPGLERNFKVAESLEMLHDPIMGDGWFAPHNHGHSFSIARVATDGGINHATHFGLALCDRLVYTAHFPRLQLVHQAGVGPETPGHHHDARGFFVQAVHDA